MIYDETIELSLWSRKFEFILPEWQWQHLHDLWTTAAPAMDNDGPAVDNDGSAVSNDALVRAY